MWFTLELSGLLSGFIHQDSVFCLWWDEGEELVPRAICSDFFLNGRTERWWSGITRAAFAIHLGWTLASPHRTLNDNDVLKQTEETHRREALILFLSITTDPKVSSMCVSHVLKVYLELAPFCWCLWFCDGCVMFPTESQVPWQSKMCMPSIMNDQWLQVWNHNSWEKIHLKNTWIIVACNFTCNY